MTQIGHEISQTFYKKSFTATKRELWMFNNFLGFMDLHSRLEMHFQLLRLAEDSGCRWMGRRSAGDLIP